MVYKSNVGDFPLKVYPCKYWFVRYAVACTYLSDKQAELVRLYSAYLDKLYEEDESSELYKR